MKYLSVDNRQRSGPVQMTQLSTARRARKSEVPRYGDGEQDPRKGELFMFVAARLRFPSCSTTACWAGHGADSNKIQYSHTLLTVLYAAATADNLLHMLVGARPSDHAHKRNKKEGGARQIQCFKRIFENACCQVCGAPNVRYLTMTSSASSRASDLR